jgi:hypothetical protein
MCLPVNSIGYPAVEARDALKQWAILNGQSMIQKK